MRRYKQLVLAKLNPDQQHPMTMRELAVDIGMPVTSLHNYVHLPTLARVENIEKMAAYFGEDLGSLYSEDDDLTAKLVAKVRRLSDREKEQLLETLN